MKIFLKIGFVLLVCLFCSLPESYGADLEGDIAPFTIEVKEGRPYVKMQCLL